MSKMHENDHCIRPLCAQKMLLLKSFSCLLVLNISNIFAIVFCDVEKFVDKGQVPSKDAQEHLCPHWPVSHTTWSQAEPT